MFIMFKIQVKKYIIKKDSDNESIYCLDLSTNEDKKINDEVLEAYGREYGAEAASILKSYENTDFNAI